MKTGRKSGNLQGKSQRWREKRKSFSNTKEISQSHARIVGRKEDVLGDRLNTLSFDIIDSAYNCPLSTYIDMIVDDKLEGLVISGSPSREQLEEAKMKIISEFTEISGGNEAIVNAEFVKTYYEQSNTLLLLDASMLLINQKRYDEAIKFLNRHGVKCAIPQNDAEHDALVKAIEMKYKNKAAKFKEATTKYKSLYKKGEKPTRKYYNRILIMLSTCEVIKIQLNPKQMTVAEFAEYLNVFNEYQNQLKIRKYGRK